MDLWTRINPDVLYQPFRRKVELMLAACLAREAGYLPTSGLRTYEEQNKLYAQGRTAPGKIVTYAQGGYSQHNFGIAVDCTRDADLAAAGLQPDWTDAAYEVLSEEASNLGLESGLRWQRRDPPHVQLPIGKYNIEESDLREMYDQGGITTVFAFLDSYAW